MAGKKLSFTFHNPNSAGETAEHILRIFSEANMAKIDAAIREAQASEYTGSGADLSDTLSIIDELA